MLVSAICSCSRGGRVIHAVQFQVAGAQQQLGFPLAPQQGAAPGAQFVQAERLGHQVVGAAVEAADPRFHFLTRGQHQHGQIGIHHAHFFEHLLAILHRQVQIEDGQVGQILAKRLHGGNAIAGHAHAMAVRLQPPAQKRSQRPIVFRNQQSHRNLSRPFARRLS